MHLRHLAFLGGAVLAACAAPDSEPTSALDESALTRTKTLENVCWMSVHGAEAQRTVREHGVLYVAYCASGGAPGRVARIDLRAGSERTIGSYDPDVATLSFHDAGPTFAVWSTTKPTVEAGISRHRASIYAWDASLSTAASVDESAALPIGFDDGRPHLQALKLVSRGRLLVAWEDGHHTSRIGVLALPAGHVTWEMGGRVQASRIDLLPSGDRKRFFVRTSEIGWPTQGHVIDVSGASPTATALDRGLIPSSLPYTWDGDEGPFDGKRLVLKWRDAQNALSWVDVDVTTGQWTRLGPHRFIEPGGVTIPEAKANADGTFALLSHDEADRTKTMLRIARPGAPVSTAEIPGTLTSIQYVAPDGAFVLLGEDLNPSRTARRLKFWRVRPGAGTPPELLDPAESYDPLAIDASGAHPLVSLRLDDGTMRVLRLDATGAVTDTLALPERSQLLGGDRAISGNACLFDVSGPVAQPLADGCLDPRPDLRRGWIVPVFASPYRAVLVPSERTVGVFAF